MYRVVSFYKTTYEKCPASEFLDSLDDKAVQKAVLVLKITERFRHRAYPVFHKTCKYRRHLGMQDKIFRKHIPRILCFIYNDSNVILTNGFMKKMQKTLRAEIELAEKI